MSGGSRVLKFLRSFQGSPLFANLAIHAWLAAWLVTAFGVAFPHYRIVVLAVGIALAAAKEFWFDHRYEIPPQPYKNAAQDFAGYVLGGVLGMLTWWALS